MFRKTNEKPLPTIAAPTKLGDEELSAVSGAGGLGHAYGHAHGGPPWLTASPVSQTNVSGPIIQIAIGNEGSVTQIAGVSQTNSVG